MKMKRTVLFSTLAIMFVGSIAPAEAGGYRRRPRTTTTNTAPLISGTPSTSVQAATAYTFTPTASDAQNNTLNFYISHKPAWASFSSSTGRLTGTPSSTQAGTYSNITVRVSDGYLSSYLPAFGITVTAPPVTTPANSAPVISGAPATSVTSGSLYSFTPKASDSDGNMLAFSVSNKPAWAIFSTATGSLAGTPTSQQAGSYAGIAISVSDGVVTASLPSFGVTVNSAVVTLGSATLSWFAPTQNTDGSSLTDLAGFRVYHGTSAGALNEVVQIQGAGSTGYTYLQLTAGMHYFAVTAYTRSGVESALSAVGSKALP